MSVANYTSRGELLVSGRSSDVAVTLRLQWGGQEERSQALGLVLEGGKLEGYSGWRRSLKGTRFQVLGVTLFNITSPSGVAQPSSVQSFDMPPS